MNANELYKLLGDLPDDYVTAAAGTHRQSRISLHVIIPAIAACFVLLIAAAVYPKLRTQMPEMQDDSIYSMETTAEAKTTAAVTTVTESLPEEISSAKTTGTKRTTSAAVTTEQTAVSQQTAQTTGTAAPAQHTEAEPEPQPESVPETAAVSATEPPASTGSSTSATTPAITPATTMTQAETGQDDGRDHHVTSAVTTRSTHIASTKNASETVPTSTVIGNTETIMPATTTTKYTTTKKVVHTTTTAEVTVPYFVSKTRAKLPEDPSGEQTGRPETSAFTEQPATTLVTTTTSAEPESFPETQPVFEDKAAQIRTDGENWYITMRKPYADAALGNGTLTPDGLWLDVICLKQDHSEGSLPDDTVQLILTLPADVSARIPRITLRVTETATVKAFEQLTAFQTAIRDYT